MSTLSIISYNMQAAIGTRRAHHYLTRAHRQLFHVRAKDRLLTDIGALIDAYDMACIQEVDLGGRRSGYRSQVDQLLRATSYSDATYQENRAVRDISRHGNAIFSRARLLDVVDLKLPGSRTGRGAVWGRHPRGFVVVNLHLSLGRDDQNMQLDAVATELSGEPQIIVCGDFNCTAKSGQVRRFCETLNLKPTHKLGQPTYPSWNPRLSYDHILASQDMRVKAGGVIDSTLSDHRPIGADIEV